MSLIKSQLVQNITDQNPHLYIKDVERIINSIFSEITKSLAEGRRVELRGFGAFSVQKRKERIGRNPRTGDAVNVSAKYIPRFKQGKELRIKLNSTNKVDNTLSSTDDTDSNL
jgi:integration host factor subunit beta